MSFESGRKLGLTASLFYIILPVVAAVGAVALIISIIFSTAARVAAGTAASSSPLVFAGFTILIITIAAASIVGVILFMVAMYRLSNYYGEPAIFKNILYAFLLNIISTIVVFALEFATMLSLVVGLSQTSTPSTVATPFTQFIFPYLIAIGVALVFAIVNGLLYMRAFNKLKEKSGVDNFGTAGLLYLIGAIIPLVAWIAWIFAAMGFNKLKTSPTTTPTVSYPTPPLGSSTTQTKRCSNCGTENRADSLYCSFCGKPLE